MPFRARPGAPRRRAGRLSDHRRWRRRADRRADRAACSMGWPRYRFCWRRRRKEVCKIAVSGEQWWWRVRYTSRQAATRGVELANEIRLPVGEPVEFRPGESRCHSLLLDSFARRQDGHDSGAREPAWRLNRPRPASFAAPAPNTAGRLTRLMSFYVVVRRRRIFRPLARAAGAACTAAMRTRSRSAVRNCSSPTVAARAIRCAALRLKASSAPT